MKKIKFLTALLITICLTTNSFAGNDPDRNQKRIFNKIGQYLSFPDLLKKNSEQSFVFVEIFVGAEGQLFVTESCGNPDLQEYVTKQIEKIKMNSFENIQGQTFQYKIDFQG